MRLKLRCFESKESNNTAFLMQIKLRNKLAFFRFNIQREFFSSGSCQVHIEKDINTFIIDFHKKKINRKRSLKLSKNVHLFFLFQPNHLNNRNTSQENTCLLIIPSLF
jgi:hypothetical protein